MMAAMVMFILLIVTLIASYNHEIAVFISRHMVTVFIISVLLFITLMITFFMILTRNSIKYLDEINHNLHKIASGNLEINIPVRRNDDLGELAKTVNSMSEQLKRLIEEERNWERAKNQLITNVSHDIRTPLTSVRGYMELIINHQYKDEACLKQYTQIVYNKCKDLQMLVDDLFEYAKLNNSEMKIKKNKVNLGELIEQVVIGFIPTLEESQMAYRLKFTDEKVDIMVDPILIARLLNNLIINAIKYGKEGKYLDIELHKQDGEAIIRVINFGDPIKQEDIPYIFDNFYRSDQSITQKSGSGLGLTIAKNIVEKHNGSIEVESRESRTIFEVRLPYMVHNKV